MTIKSTTDTLLNALVYAVNLLLLLQQLLLLLLIQLLRLLPTVNTLVYAMIRTTPGSACWIIFMFGIIFGIFVIRSSILGIFVILFGIIFGRFGMFVIIFGIFSALP